MSSHPTLVIGFIGFGEAASEIARGLHSEGGVGLEAYDVNYATLPHSKLIRERANSVGITLCTSLRDLIKKSTVIVSANSATAAVSVAAAAAPHLTPEHLYVDINAASPLTKKAAAEAVASSRCKFVDGAVMGPVPRSQHRVPILASGAGAAKFRELMTPHGMVITDLGQEPGKASATKLVRSIFMKGAAALLYELSLAAKHYDVLDLVLDGIAEDMNAGPFAQMTTRLISGTAIHAGRRIHEMEDVIDTLQSAGLRHDMSDATLRTLEWIHGLGLSEPLGGKVPADFHAVTKLLPTGESRSPLP